MASTPSNAPLPDASSAESAGGGDASSTEEMIKQALAEAQNSIDTIKDEVAGQPKPLTLPDLGSVALDESAITGIEMLSDVDLHVTVELGRTEMLVEDVLKLNAGSIVELDKLAGDPVDVYVNNRLVARGEVLVLNDNFCIRISEIVSDLQEQVTQAAALQNQVTNAG